jgi:hypothetical protein
MFPMFRYRCNRDNFSPGLCLKSKTLAWQGPRPTSLSDQVSNLDSSEPKSDVLPVTPSDNQFPNNLGTCLSGRQAAKIENIFKAQKTFLLMNIGFLIN